MSRSSPLLWPMGRARTRVPITSKFDSSLSASERGVYKQIALLGGTNVIISSNLSVGRGGQILERQTAEDTGIAVYFDYNGSRHCVAIDRYRYFWENMRAIEKSIEALRGLERWGGAEIVKTSLGGFKELPANAIVTPYTARPWHEMLEVLPTASMDIVEAAYKRKLHSAHPDKGGDTAAFMAVQAAFKQAKEQYNGGNHA